MHHRIPRVFQHLFFFSLSPFFFCFICEETVRLDCKDFWVESLLWNAVSDLWHLNSFLYNSYINIPKPSVDYSVPLDPFLCYHDLSVQSLKFNVFHRII